MSSKNIFSYIQKTHLWWSSILEHRYCDVRILSFGDDRFSGSFSRILREDIWGEKIILAVRDE